MHPQALELAERVGEFIEYWGFKRIHGRIWTLAFLAQKPVDANFLMTHLDVSKALVSLSIKELLGYSVLMEAPKEEGTQRYIVNEDIVGVISNVLVNREAKMVSEIRRVSELFGRLPQGKVSETVRPERLESLANMAGAAEDFLETLLTGGRLSAVRLWRSLQLAKH